MELAFPSFDLVSTCVIELDPIERVRPNFTSSYLVFTSFIHFYLDRFSATYLGVLLVPIFPLNSL